MLRALKTATESYLEERITHVIVTLPFHQSSLFLDDLTSALSAISLETPRFLRSPSGIAVCITQCTAEFDDCWDQTPQNILSVDYTRSSLTGSIFEEQCCIYETRNRVHFSALGSNSVAEDPLIGRERLESALAGLLRGSLGSQPNFKAAKLDEVLLIGESAGDPVLRDVLNKLLSEHHNEAKHAVLRPHREPVFAASGAAAWNCLRELKDPFTSLEHYEN
jgi:hypothetical protein